MRWTARGLLTLSFALSVCALSAQQFPPQQPPQQQPPQQQSPQQQPMPQPRQPGPDVVATVNDEPITRPELEAAVREQARGQQVEPQAHERLRKQALDSLIEARLIEEYVREEGPDVEAGEVESVVERIKQQLADQNFEFRQFLAMQGHTEESFAKRIEGSLGWQKLQQQQMTPDTLEAFFEQNADHFEADRFEEAQQEVVRAYAMSLWQSIIRRMQPEAEIKVVEPAGAATPAPQQPPMRAPGR